MLEKRTESVSPFPKTVGALPDGWRREKLDDVTVRGSGHTPDQSQPSYWNGGVKWVSLADSWRLDNGVISDTEKKISQLGLAKSSAVLHKAGTVIMSRDAGVGKSAVLGEEMAVSQHFIAWECTKKDILDPWFLYHWLQVRKEFFERMAVGSTIKTIGLPLFKRLTIDFPPLDEQRKLAEVLRTWDEAIEKLQALRGAKARLLDGLRARLLFGSLRMHDRERKWVQRRLADVTHELTARNSGNSLSREAVMGVTKAQGVVPMREQTIAGDISRYKRLPPRAFAYNPMRINVGSIAMNERGEEVLVSPDYVVFACDDDGLDPDYLDHLRKTPWWTHYISSGASGSVRMRTYYDDLAALKLPLPDLDEQRDIARILNTARDNLALTEREIDALKRQKRGLMQKLLTGEWRVNGGVERRRAI